VFFAAPFIDEVATQWRKRQFADWGAEHLQDAAKVGMFTMLRPVIVGQACGLVVASTIYENITYLIGYLYGLTKTKYIKDNGDAIIYVPALEKQNMIIFVPSNTHQVKECIPYTTNKHNEIILSV
jgi:hypothetical protein